MARLIEFASNHPWLSAGVVVSLLAALANEIRIRTAGVSGIDASAAVRLINQGATVVDIREAEEYATGHIVDAQNVSEPEADGGNGLKLKKNRPVLLVCDNGSRSGRAATNLRRKGFEQVFSLRGGLQSWRQENLPVVSVSESGA